uniref:Uncharacterized protein n=1 Tax=Parascaris equorum TaxID=6256 RepID=A0A914S0F4_PAREQ
MVAMASCSNGSTRGYDELIPFSVDGIALELWFMADIANLSDLERAARGR